MNLSPQNDRLYDLQNENRQSKIFQFANIVIEKPQVTAMMIADDGQVAYDFNEPISINGDDKVDPLLSALAATKAFRRLATIRFLGAIDYLGRQPNGQVGNRRHSRLTHSFGVARLALGYCKLSGKNTHDRQLACAAAMLHDIGHAPLSHSLEPVFKERFGIEHHLATRRIVRGEASLGDGIRSILNKFDLDPDEVIEVIEGKNDPFNGFFSGPINFDTIEAILRTINYHSSGLSVPRPEQVVVAASRRRDLVDQRLVDQFWHCKGEAYRYVINSRLGVLADWLCQTIMRRHIDKFSEEDYYSTERAAFRKLPGLVEALRGHPLPNEILPELLHPIEYYMRTFVVRNESDFFAHHDIARYTQAKERRALSPTQQELRIVEKAGGLGRDVAIRKDKGLFRN